jgi:transposase-like protein
VLKITGIQGARLMRRKRDLVKEQFWRERIRRQRADGSSVREFCLREGLSRASFHNWRREIARRDAEGRDSPGTRTSPRREKRATRAEERPTSVFVPVVVGAPASVEIILASDTIVRVPPDRRTLELVLAILMERAAATHGDRSRAAGAPPC